METNRHRRICVSVGAKTLESMKAQCQEAVKQGAGLVEVRVDHLEEKVRLEQLLSNRAAPTIVTCRRKADGGDWDRSERERLELLRKATSLADFVDLEWDAAETLPRSGTAQRIVSYHDFEKTPQRLSEIHAQLATADADIVKIATTARSMLDNLRVLALIRESSTPTVGICMGELGVPTRILAGKMGAPFSYAALGQDRAVAPGQLSVTQMRELYRYDSIDRWTEVYGIVANPVEHSLSPVVHNAAFEQLGSNKVYVPFLTPADELPDFIAACQALDVKGLSISIPYKEAVLGLLTGVEPPVDEIRAVNTVVLTDDRLLGFNTDYSAALASIEGELAADGDSRGTKALVLGAGGAARAVVHALRMCNFDITICSRSLRKAKTLAAHLNCRALEWDQRHREWDFVANCTPIGMYPIIDATPFDGHRLQARTIVFDAVYNPEQTMLVKDARQRGCRVVTGVDMFLRQAERQFALFTGVAAPVDTMRRSLDDAIVQQVTC